MKPIIVDPGLYLSEGTEMFYATQKRELPSAYRMFTGVFARLVLYLTNVLVSHFYLIIIESAILLKCTSVIYMHN